jgi:hypothetical protein
VRPKRHAPHTLPCASKTKTLDVQSLSYVLLEPYLAGQASSLSMLGPFAPLGDLGQLSILGAAPAYAWAASSLRKRGPSLESPQLREDQP